MRRKFKARSGAAVLTALLGIVLLAVEPSGAGAIHHVDPDYILAPYTGTWANPDDYTTWPEYHYKVATGVGAYGGDWATDFYASPGTDGDFHVYPTRAGASVDGTVVIRNNACESGNYQAGVHYRIEVNNSQLGTRGWAAYGHVDGHDPATGLYYQWDLGSIPEWARLGWITWWDPSPCYQVYTSSGNHWHIEGYQYSHWSCYQPWGIGDTLTEQSVTGNIGANTTGLRQAC